MPAAERLVGAFAGVVVARPRLVLALFLVCTAALGWQARRFEMDAGADTLLTKENEHYLQTQIVDQRFAAQEFLLIAYKPREWPVLSEQTFRDLRALKKELKRLERVESVRTILDVPLLPANAGLSASTDPAEWTIERHNFSLKQLQQEFSGHPIYEDLLINKAQTATAIQVLFRRDRELAAIDGHMVALQQKSLAAELSRDERAELARLGQRAEPLLRRLDKVRARELEAVRGIVTGYEGGADIYLGGVHALGYQLIQIITNDLIVFGAAIAAMICALLYLLFRRLEWVAIPAVCCACSVLSTLGLFGLLGLKATVISSSFIALQLILTLAIAIHLIVQYREYSAEHPAWDQAALVRHTLERKAGPCFYAGITNVVGFASLLFSNIRPVIDFGWMMSIAMFFSIGVTLILFPAMMAMFRKEHAPPQRGLHPARYVLDFFARLSLKHPLPVAAVSVAVLAAAAGGLFLLDVENSFINYFRDSTKVRQELTFIDRELGGTTPLDVTYTIPRSDRKQDLVLTAENVQTLQRIQQSLKQREAVGQVLSVVNFTELAKKLNGGKPLTEYELTALYWTMEPNLRSDLLGSFFSPEYSQARIAVRIKDATEGLNRSELLAGIKHDMAQLGIGEGQYMLTNLFVLYQDILQQLFESQILTIGLSFGVLSLMFLAIFRSVRIALIGITPNILSTLIVLGLMGWLGIPLDLMTIMIAAIAMGITVDDTIHYVHRYLEELQTAPPEKAVERCHASVGYALLYTSLIVVLGFSLLAFSDFIPSALFGLLTALAMTLAVVFDLSLLPVLLNRFVRTAR
jgi:hypothetical protein